jgi:hypothetical protein
MLVNKSTWHKLLDIDRKNKVGQNGSCSICGPVYVGYDTYNNQFYCTNKVNKRLAERKISDPDFKKHKQKSKQEYRWKYIYRLTSDQVLLMLEEQNHKCCICSSVISLETSSDNSAHIDHDHNCCAGDGSANFQLCGNCNRGLLCSRCNLAIGNFNDDINLMNNAIKYLEKYNS